MITELHQFGISEVSRDMLKADTDVLYGKNKLMKFISANPIKFEREQVDVVNSIGIYLWASDGEPIEERASNAFDDYRLDIKFVVKKTNLKEAFLKFSKAWERVKYLFRLQMTSGLFLSQYYSDPNAQIYSVMPLPHTLQPPRQNEDGVLVSRLEGAILIQVNRY